MAEEVELFVVEAERESLVEGVFIAEKEGEPVPETVGRGARVREPVTVSVTEARRLTLGQEVEDAERVIGPVAEGEGVPVSVTEPFGVLVMLREMGGLRLPALQRVGEGDAEGVFDRGGVLVGLGLLLIEEERAGDLVPVLEKAIVRLEVPDEVDVLDVAALRLPVEHAVGVLDCEMEPVDVPETRIERLFGAERVWLVEPVDVLDERREKDIVGLPLEVFEPAPERVGLGLEEDVLELVEVVVCVLEDVIVRVAVAVEVCVLERRGVTVAAELLEDVFETAPVAVGRGVGRIVLLRKELILGARVPGSERVDVVVLVDVFD